ncbi:MAG: hypothetical protein HC849_19585 [Oscillatoriales cyanobacterium RU_3_3]|nr:hypothetical protein [Microcoleus sp. SU_5_6]NJL67689.1 hypothetical protein [Microcoleus sp. SM1_3_4]NJM61900.1 hypothetical protein [Oscillatoriales cyanobacterium RU_3_3]NJR21573.1 hypothetical protein [Richelia sp. CSU_2_1]
MSIVLYLTYHQKSYTRFQITNPAITNYQLPITNPRIYLILLRNAM